MKKVPCKQNDSMKSFYQTEKVSLGAVKNEAFPFPFSFPSQLANLGEYHDKKRDLATIAKLPLSFSFSFSVSFLQKVKLQIILYHIILSGFCDKR